MSVEALEQEAEDAFLTGRLESAVEAWTRAHTEALRGGDVPRAVRSAFWAAFALLNTGETARGGGWADRVRHLLDDLGQDVVERGYEAYGLGLKAIFSGDLDGSHAAFN